MKNAPTGYECPFCKIADTLPAPAPESAVVLVEPCTERDLIILNDHYQRQPLDGGKVHRFVKYSRFSRSIADPGHRNSRLILQLECEGYPCCDRHNVADMAYRRDDAVAKVAYVQVAPASRRVIGAQVTTKHIGKRHTHLVASACIAYHGGDEVA